MTRETRVALRWCRCVARTHPVLPCCCVPRRWAETLNIVSDVLDEWIKVQRSWLYLQPIFESPDIQKQVLLTRRVQSGVCAAAHGRRCVLPP